MPKENLKTESAEDQENDIYDNFIKMVEDHAKRANSIVLDRRFYEAALEEIFINKIECIKYPNGMPALFEVYRIALECKLREEAKDVTKH